MEVSCSCTLKEKDVPFRSIKLQLKSIGDVVVMSVNAKGLLTESLVAFVRHSLETRSAGKARKAA